MCERRRRKDRGDKEAEEEVSVNLMVSFTAWKTWEEGRPPSLTTAEQTPDRYISVSRLMSLTERHFRLD